MICGAAWSRPQLLFGFYSGNSALHALLLSQFRLVSSFMKVESASSDRTFRLYISLYGSSEENNPKAKNLEWGCTKSGHKYFCGPRTYEGSEASRAL
jgi:hypothetical protein